MLFNQNLKFVVILISSSFAMSGYAQKPTNQKKLPLPKKQQLIQESNNKNEIEMPSRTYGNTLVGSEWVETKNGGGRVAIGEGIEFEDINYYLSLTWTLVALNKDRQTIWSQPVSAFWNHIEIVEIKLDDGSSRNVLALRNKRKEEMADFVEYYDLNSGEKITLAKQVAKPEGKHLKIDKVWYGGDAHNAERIFAVIESEEEWAELRPDVFPENVGPLDDAFDSDSELLVVLALGPITNCRGISIANAFESDEQITVQLRHHTYQTSGSSPIIEQPYGAFVLPKRNGKKYLLQVNRQGYIGGPPIWKTLEEFRR